MFLDKVFSLMFNSISIECVMQIMTHKTEYIFAYGQISSDPTGGTIIYANGWKGKAYIASKYMHSLYKPYGRQQFYIDLYKAKTITDKY